MRERGESPQAKRPPEKRRERGTVSSLRPSRAFLIRRKKKEWQGRATVRHRNGKQLLPREKEEREKVREKERDLEDRIPQRPSD